MSDSKVTSEQVLGKHTSELMDELEEGPKTVCAKCDDVGFVEKEHGLIRVICDCAKGKEILKQHTGEGKDGTSGTGKDNKPTGSSDTGKHKRTRKSKAGRKTAKRLS